MTRTHSIQPRKQFSNDNPRLVWAPRNHVVDLGLDPRQDFFVGKLGVGHVF